MTEDYKKQLLKYITDSLTTTSPTSEEIIEEVVNKTRSATLSLLPSSVYNFRIEGTIKSNKNDMYVMYGGFIDTYRNSRGIILLYDNDFNPIKAFYEFSNGTKLRYIQCMNQNEDGTFYMVDDTVFSFDNATSVLTSEKRFVMMNNFTSSINSEYKLNFRTSYIFGSSYKNFYCHTLEKDSSEAHYVMIGQGTFSDGNIYGNIRAIELKINVGSANEWSKVDYNATSGSPATFYKYGGCFIHFNEGKAMYKVLGDQSGNGGTFCLTKSYNSTSFSKSIIYNSPNYNDDVIDTEHFQNQCVFLNENEVYFVLTNQLQTWSGTSENKHIELLKYDFTTSTITSIYNETLSSAITLMDAYIGLALNQGKLYINYVRMENENDYSNYYIQRYEGSWNPLFIRRAIANVNKTIISRAFSINNDFNIVKLMSYSINPYYYGSNVMTKEIYNPTQYNGESYKDVNMFSPLYSNLYSNGSLIFSRNLYNISKQNNMTMSSVEIPNTYLNDTTITQNDLISETNFKMNSDTTQWTKNIYEVVDLNFLNTISVIDEDTDTSYMQSAIKINDAITDGTLTDYQNTPCTKYRINYTDTTTSVDNIAWTNIDDTHKYTEITIYVDKAITSIDFISNDESTIYLTIPLQVDIGKYYTINQKIKIE